MTAALASLGTLAILVGAVVGVLRSDWLLRHVAPDPGPTYSPLDRLDGLQRLPDPATADSTASRKEAS